MADMLNIRTSGWQRIVYSFTNQSIEYNPKYFPDPALYKPSRWYGEDGTGIVDFDAYTAFSFGWSCLPHLSPSSSISA